MMDVIVQMLSFHDAKSPRCYVTAVIPPPCLLVADGSRAAHPGDLCRATDNWAGLASDVRV